MINNFDQKFIAYALNLAKKNLGITSPNPVVGCVIVKEGKIISSGITQKNGRPHAERIAIEKVFDKKILEGAVIYVTLEPCSHFGETSPCVDEIIKHKFKKVVIATKDSDERVNGASLKKLSDAGIEVICGILEKEAREINRAFFKSRLHKMPFVTLKLATSLDGKIATKDFDSKWITSEKARFFSHHLRSINDAILVGSNTIKKDNPTLDCRISGLENYSPRPIIVSSNMDFDWNFKIFQKTGRGRAIILTNKSEKSVPAETILCAEKNHKVDLVDALRKLCASGINSVLIEGGQNIATQFLKENLVDELIWIRNKKIIGNDGIPAIGQLGYSKIDDVLNSFVRREVRDLEDDIIETYTSGV